MARAITSDELEMFRSDGQWCKLYLAFFRPNVIYTAHLASVPSSTDRVYQIGFNSGVGTLANVMPNMTLYVGTNAGSYDLGMCRIRKAPIAGTFYIGLTSEINWAVGGTIYLTVVDDFDIWAKHATIASDTLSMDVEVGYSDQHSAFAPVPVLGSHAAILIDGSGVNVQFDASDSWVIGSTITGYAWTAPGSSASSGMSTATPTVTYDDPTKDYTIYCVVTAANGKSTTGVRHVFARDHENNPPATVFQISQCIGDYDTGGWMFDMTMEAEASLSEIRDRELVVLFAEDWYGVPPFQQKQSIGPIENRENIVCVGRIVGESIRWDRESGLVHFTVQGFQHWLSKIKAFPVELSFVGSATDWAGMPAMNVDRILWHILYWHSTAIETMDFYSTNDTRYSADGKTIASNIWGQLNDIAFSKLLAVPGVDRFGRLFVEVDPQMMAVADRDFPEVMQLTDDDWAEAIDFSRVIVQDCSLISLNAEEVNSAGTSVTRYSLSPGHVPERYGEPEMMDRLLCASQAQSNALAGLLLGWRTNQFPDMPIVLAQNNRMIDVFPRQTCGIVVDVGDTPREIAVDMQLIPRRVAFYYDGDTGYFHSEINFEGETFQQISTNGDIPDTDEIAMETPPIPSLPSLPDLPILLPGLDTDTSANVGPRKVLVHDPVAGLLLSVNFNTSSPTWIQVNAGLTTTQFQKIDKVVVCPNGAVYVGCTQHNSNGFLARAPYIGATFVIIETHASMIAKYGSSDNVGLIAINCNRLVSESVLYCLSQAGENIKTYLGFGSTFTAKATFTINVNNNADVSYGLGAWLFTGAGFVRLSADAASVTGTGSITGSDVGTSRHSRIATSGETIHWRGGSNDLILGHNNCASFTTGLASDLDAAYLYADKVTHDVTGRYIMTRNASGPNPVKSSDFGYSLSLITTLPTLVNWYFANISAAQWIAVSSYIYFTDDFGVSAWHDKRGNILSLAPLLACDVVKVIEY